MNRVTLRIKKVYFDLIASGQKTVEYRDAKAFYHRLFAKKERITHLKLHYQRPTQMLVRVRGIILMPTPQTEEFIGDKDCPMGSHVYAIMLVDPEVFEAQ